MTHFAIVAGVAAACGGSTDTGSSSDASISDASISDAGSSDGATSSGNDASATPPCWTSSPPPDASAPEQLGVVGECCTTSDTCKSNSACVGGRCCIHLRDSGRRCTVGSDCCSGICPTENDPDAGLISGECVPYP